MEHGSIAMNPNPHSGHQSSFITMSEKSAPSTQQTKITVSLISKSLCTVRSFCHY